MTKTTQGSGRAVFARPSSPNILDKPAARVGPAGGNQRALTLARHSRKAKEEKGPETGLKSLTQLSLWEQSTNYS